jgi:hypothetical protein
MVSMGLRIHLENRLRRPYHSVPKPLRIHEPLNRLHPVTKALSESVHWWTSRHNVSQPAYLSPKRATVHNCDRRLNNRLERPSRYMPPKWTMVIGTETIPHKLFRDVSCQTNPNTPPNSSTQQTHRAIHRQLHGESLSGETGGGQSRRV